MRLIFALLLMALAACSPPPRGHHVRMQAQIVINRPIAEVFAFAADPMNDTEWRNETRGFTASGPPALGTLYEEVIDTGIQDGFVMRTIVTGFEENRVIRAEGRDGRVFSAQRDFDPLGPNKTRIIYTVAADDHLVREITLLALDPDRAARHYTVIMYSYLDQLKRVLER